MPISTRREDGHWQRPESRSWGKRGRYWDMLFQKTTAQEELWWEYGGNQSCEDQEHTPKCSRQMPQETYAILPDQREPLGKPNSNVWFPRVRINVVPAMSTPSKNSGLLCISKGRGVGTRRTRALFLPARTAFKDSRSSCSYFVCSVPTRNNLCSDAVSPITH